MDFIRRNTSEKIRKEAEKNEKITAIEKTKLLDNLQAFFSKDQTVTEQWATRRGQIVREHFVLPKLPEQEAKETTGEFVKFYETNLKPNRGINSCEVKPDENGVNKLVFIYNAEYRDSTRSTINELEKIAKPYGKAFAKSLKFQKMLGKTQSVVLSKDNSR